MENNSILNSFLKLSVLLFVGETQKKNAGTDGRLKTGESRSETMQVP